MSKSYAGVYENIAYSLFQVDESMCAPVVLLHGLGGDLNAFVYFQERLAMEGVDSVAVDLPGHGLSLSVKGVVDVEAVVETLRGLMRYLGWDEYVLVGHCLGGMVASVWSSMHSKEVVRIVLLNSAAMEVMPHTRLWLARTGGWWRVISQVFWHHQGERRRYSRYYGSRDFSVGRIFDDVTHTSLGDYAAMMAMMLSVKLRGQFAYYPGQVYVIGSDNDRIVPMSAVEQYSGWFGSSVMQVIPQGTHVPLVNAPLMLMQILREIVVVPHV